MAEDSIVCVGVYRRRRAGGSGLKVWRGKADVQHAGYLMNHTLGSVGTCTTRTGGIPDPRRINYPIRPGG